MATSAGVLKLLNEVAGSEHFLRNPQAFAEVLRSFGLELRSEGGFHVVDPAAEAAERKREEDAAAAYAAQEAENRAEAERDRAAAEASKS